MSTNIAEGNGHDVFLRRAHMGQVAMSTVSSSWGFIVSRNLASSLWGILAEYSLESPRWRSRRRGTPSGSGGGELLYLAPLGPEPAGRPTRVVEHPDLRVLVDVVILHVIRERLPHWGGVARDVVEPLHALFFTVDVPR